MEKRSDSTWMFVGIGVGCLFVLLVSLCGLSGACLYLSRPSESTPSWSPPPYVPPATTVDPFPPPTVVPPSTVPPSTVPPPVPGDPLDDRAPRLVHATVESVTGTPGVSVGQLCEFNVERRDRDDGTFWCNAQVVCGGQLLYGGPEAGYFPCTLFAAPSRGVVGSDAARHPPIGMAP